MERLTKRNIQEDKTILYSSRKDCELFRSGINQKLGKFEDLEEQTGMSLEPINKSYLIDWLINSVDNSIPVWTKEHIEELLKDFDVYFKDLLVHQCSELNTMNNKLLDENAELEQQLKDKDKALDKSCDFISKIGINDKWKGSPPCENCKHLKDICFDCEGTLKEVFENGTN